MGAQMLFGISNVPGFIPGCPGNDGGMIPVTQENFAPFSLGVADRRGGIRVTAPAGEFTPGKVAQTVGPVMETFFKNLLMQAGAVKTSGYGQFDIPFERRIGRGGPDSIGIKSLVEYQALIQRLIVEKNLVAFDMDFTQPGIGTDSIDNRITVTDFQFQIIQERIVGRPGPGIRNRERKRNSVQCGAGGFADDSITVFKYRGISQSAARCIKRG